MVQRPWPTFDGGAKDGTVAPVATRGITKCYRSRAGPDRQGRAV